MSKKRALILSLLAAFAFSAAVLLLRFPRPSGGAAEISAKAVPEAAILSGSGGEQPALELLPGEKLNINIATAEELMRLPGIGPALSGAIVAYREENGVFSSVEDIMRVDGIGEGRFAAIEEYICVS
ncbi:MAG: ComEA family DNA-binding protein [Clostridiales bacterium]|nr:ComEA family DNA-binding protein [Clostridiales bacterium]